MSRIYVASSCLNAYQPGVVAVLRAAGHEVYDFQNPTVDYGNRNNLARTFQWSEIDAGWYFWSREECVAALSHPLSEQGFASDLGAMRWADTCVLVLPSGRSAHVKAGWMAGASRRVIVFMPKEEKPELMYKLFGSICLDLESLVHTVGAPFLMNADRHEALGA